MLKPRRASAVKDWLSVTNHDEVPELDFVEGLVDIKYLKKLGGGITAFANLAALHNLFLWEQC